jgi:hypothetical protein
MRDFSFLPSAEHQWPLVQAHRHFPTEWAVFTCFVCTNLVRANSDLIHPHLLQSLPAPQQS